MSLNLFSSLNFNSIAAQPGIDRLDYKEENKLSNISKNTFEVELQTLQDKLRRKQECLVQVQAEKENQFVALR